MDRSSKLWLLCVLFLSFCWSCSSLANENEAEALVAVRKVAPGKVLSVASAGSKVTVRVLTDRGRVETYVWTAERGARVKGGEH